MAADHLYLYAGHFSFLSLFGIYGKAQNHLGYQNVLMRLHGNLLT